MTPEEMQMIYDEAYAGGILDEPQRAEDAIAQGVVEVTLRPFSGGGLVVVEVIE